LLNIDRIWWRRVTGNDLYNIEKPLPPGPKGQLHLDVPNVLALHDFFGIKSDGDSSKWKPIEIDLYAFSSPDISRKITFRPRPKNNRYDIQRQNVNSESSERHPAWTSAYGWPAIHGKIGSTEEAQKVLDKTPLILIIVRADGKFFASFLKGKLAHDSMPGKLSEIYVGKSTGSLIGLSDLESEVLNQILSGRKLTDLGELTVPKIDSNIKQKNFLPKKSKSQGFVASAELRRAIEKQAVKTAVDYFEANGWLNVQDVGDFASYDLSMVRDGLLHVVEVKGTTGLGENIILTKNEVSLHREHYPRNALVVVSEIRIVSNSPVEVTGGVIKVMQPWSLVEEWLTPLSYTYLAGQHSATS
jgi:hypothetical protein